VIARHSVFNVVALPFGLDPCFLTVVALQSNLSNILEVSKKATKILKLASHVSSFKHLLGQNI